MTWQRALAGFAFCVWCVGPAAVSAEAQPTPADRLMRGISMPPPVKTHLSAGALRPTGRVLPADRWWARDKAVHVAFSFLWTLSAQYVLVDKAGWTNRAALPVAAGSSAAVGLSKEWVDWQYGSPPQFSTRDLVADGVGIVLAVGVILL